MRHFLDITDLGRRSVLIPIRKDAGLYCGSRLRSGEVFAYVGLSQNLKDLKDLINGGVRHRGTSLIWNNPPLEPYGRTMPRALWWS